MTDIKDKMAKIVAELKKLNVNIRPVDERKIEIFDLKGQCETADFVIFFGENEEDASMIVDIGVSDPWLSSAVTFSIMNVCGLSLMQPVLVSPVDKKVYLGESAYLKLYELTSGVEVVFEDAQADEGEYGSLDDYMEAAVPGDEEVGQALDAAMGKNKRINKKEEMH